MVKGAWVSTQCYATFGIPQFDSGRVIDKMLFNIKKFHKLLEYILLVGNIMNSGSPRQKAVGFDISFLKKVSRLI